MISFSTDKIRLSRAGLCSWGKEKTALEYGHEQESNGELLQSPSDLAKKRSSDLSSHFTLGYGSAAAQPPCPGERPEGSASLLVFLSCSLSSAGVFWVGLCCFSSLLSEQSKAQGVSVLLIPVGIAYPKVTQCTVCCLHFF